MKLWSKLRSLWRKDSLDAEMAEEMRLHLELQTEQNVRRGMSPDEARYAAQRLFGGVEQIKETARVQRSILWLEDSLKDLRFAVRTLRKNPSFTFVAVVSLAIGIGLNTAVFSIINTIFYQTIRGVPQPERVLFFNDGRASQTQVEHLIEEASAVAGVTGARGLEATIALAGIERQMRVNVVPTNYFSVMKVQAAKGRLFSDHAPADRAALPEVVLNHAFWWNHLNGDVAVIGQPIRINDATLTVVGIADREFHGPGPEGPALWLPTSMADAVRRLNTDTSQERFGVFGRLAAGVSLPQAQAAIDLIVARSPELFNEQTRFRLSVGREDWRGEASPAKRVEFLLVTTVPLVIAGGLLWIACSNVGNLLLARAVQRRKEIAIRLASGASRGRLIRMLMSESLVLAVLGGAAGLWISSTTIDFVFATLAEYGAFSVQVDARVLIYTGAISVAAAFLFGLVPAWQASKADVNEALKGEAGTPAFRSTRLRGFFLITQIASSFALLVVAGTFVKSLVAQAYVGEQARLLDHLLTAEMPEPRATAVQQGAFLDSVIETISAIPGVEAVTLVEKRSAQKRRFGSPSEEAQVVDRREDVSVQRIDENYFRTAGGTMLQGEPALPATRDALLKHAIVNVVMAEKYWTLPSALDQRFQLDAENFVVTGVVQDGAAEPRAYEGLPTGEAGRLNALIRMEGQADDSVALMSGVLRNLSPLQPPPRVAPLREVTFRMLSQMTRLALFVGAIALTLAATGIYSSMAFSTRQRTHEIGVRMALGATQRAVLRLVLGDGLRIVGWGCIFGLAVAIIGLRLLFGLLSGGTGFDAVAIFCVMLFFAVVAAAACLLPAWRTAKVDPMEALRCE